MKKYYILVLALFTINLTCFSQITWDGGGGDNNWSTGANWSGNTVPSSTDNVIFDGTSSKNCDFDIQVTVATLSVLSGYNGVIDMKTLDQGVDFTFVVNSGTVIETSSTMNMTGNGLFSLGSSGTYSTNGGIFLLSTLAGNSFVFSGSIVLNNLEISKGGNGTQRNIDFGTNLTVNNLSLTSTSGTNKPTAFQGNIHIKNSFASLGISTATVTSANSANFIFDGVSATIIGASAANITPLPNIEMNTSGNIALSNNINIMGNWTGTQGTLTAGNSTVNMTGASANISGTAAAFDNLVIRPGASVTFPSGAEAKIGKTLSNGGTVSFPATFTLGLNGGTSTQSITGNSMTISGIHAYSGVRTITLNTPLDLLDFLDIDDNVTFAAGNNLTLKSTSALTARLGEVESGASVTGNVTVETVIPGGFTGWSVMGVRGVNGQLVSSWDTYVGSGGTSGIPMTCVGCVYSPSVTPNWFNSIQGWNETTAYGYDTNVVSTTALTPGKGFWVYVGDGATTSSDLKLINAGSLKTGAVNVAITANGAQSGFNLIANPYPSPISWDFLMNLGANISGPFSNAIYAFNPDFGQTEYVNGTANPGGPTSIGDIIAGGQGFYVEANSNGNVVFDETIKVNANTAGNPLIRSTSTKAGKIFRLKLQGSYDWGAATFRIHEEATSGFDKKWDAKKIFQTPGYVGYPGSYDKYTSISSKDADNVDYAIQSIGSLVDKVTIPVLAKVSVSGSYTISAYDFKDFPMCVGLIDKLNNSYHDLRLSPYVFNISDTTSTPRFELVMCKDESLNATGISEASQSSSIFITQDAQGATVKTVFEKNTKAVISVYNVIGQKLMNDVTVEGMVTTTNLPLDLHNQVVIIKVSSDTENMTKKMVLH